MHAARWACLFLALVSPFLIAQELDLTREEEAKRALRRSPVVELYNKNQASIVFLTFPVPKGGNASLNEFFVMPGVPEETGAATGFVIHPSGYIVTCAHAVSALSMQAHLSTGETLPIDVVGIDRPGDLAVVRVRPPRPLQPVVLGRGNDIMIGETVVVIGSPHGLKHSLVTGVVSALGRQVNAPGLTLQNMIQYSAGTNPGNSGGPVFNIVGEVMGVQSVTKTDAASMSFAIPTDALRKALPRLLDLERSHGIVTGLTFAGDGSTRVKDVAAGSPAAVAGVRPGDLVRRAGGRRLLGESDFHLELIDHKPGDMVALVLARDKETREAPLTLGKRPKPDHDALLAGLGLKVAPLDAAKATAMRLRVGKGFVLTDVKGGLYPDKQQPETGDVLARINDVRPNDLDHAGRILSETKSGQPVRLVFLRQRGATVTRIDVAVTPKGK